MPTTGCGYYSGEVEVIAMQQHTVALRVPIRRCALGERLIGLLLRSPDGREIADKIRIDRCEPAAADGGSERVRAAFGPDLEPINKADCTTQRCRESCTPGYKQILIHFGYYEEAARETGLGCLDISPEPRDGAT